MTTSHRTTAQLTIDLDAAQAMGLDTIDALEAALEARIPNSHFCPQCHLLTDGGPCRHHPDLAAEEITIAPSFGIHS